MHHHKIAILATVIVLAGTSVAAWRFFFPRETQAPVGASPVVFDLLSPVATSDDPRKGSSNPKHVIIELGDFQCDGCRDAAPELDAVLASNPDVQLVWKDAPNTALHLHSYDAALAARCAGYQGKFWQYHDVLFVSDSLDTDSLDAIATSLKLDLTKFHACEADTGVRARLGAAIEQAIALGIAATPYLYIDQKPIGTLTTAAEINAVLKAMN